ncbi:macro domain-containing protein [Mycobacterium sp. 29Ha]|uniref:macro domain-containing protein n=1 Tax=Mycobacterium sp. 29Ha TaxID=2939268 RepID=UPI0029394078|nr:macro domain-containing protein [Mycobacterium sp. 29Ha]MDV3136764.1 macro domain-containing protein [Mycobacterium sp. 29Ha]
MSTVSIPHLSVELGDITTQKVDVIVSPTSGAMRAQGGVSRAIRLAAGPGFAAECARRFPDGLQVGDAGWTGAGKLPAGWVIHVASPRFSADQPNKALLESCYLRALEVADELGAQTVAFPLVGAGANGWPLGDAISIAAETIAPAPTRVHEVRFVTQDRETFDEIHNYVSRFTPLKMLRAVETLHSRGYHRIRALPGMSGSGFHWRVAITTADNFDEQGHGFRDNELAIWYTTGALTTLNEVEIATTTTRENVADLILNALPNALPTADDRDYVAWFAGLMRQVEDTGELPIAYADYFEPEKGWEIGWGSGNRYPHPPSPPSSVGNGSIEWALSYNPYERLCRRPDLLDNIFGRLESHYSSTKSAPAWAGVDLLRGWAHALALEILASGTNQLVKKFTTVLSAIDNHPATRSFEFSPQRGGSVERVAQHRKELLDSPMAHTYYPQSLVGWLETYNGYERLASSDKIFVALQPLIDCFTPGEPIPRWAGPDVLRAWMFAMMESDLR